METELHPAEKRQAMREIMLVGYATFNLKEKAEAWSEICEGDTEVVEDEEWGWRVQLTQETE